MLIVLAAFLVVLFSFLAHFFHQMRYDFKNFILYILTRIQGYNYRMLTKPEEIKEILMLSDKGTVVEELIACPAWLPILSIESVNHSLWHELKCNFLTFQKLAPPKAELGLIAQHELNKFLDENNGRINSKEIAKITLKIFTKYIFKDTTFDHDSTMTELSEEQIDKIYQGGIEYRKEIAMKGKGDTKKKLEAIDIMVHLLSNNSKYKDMWDWTESIHYSVVMQPFIISPMINVSDIAVTVHQNRAVFAQSQDISLYIDYCIKLAHPFPVLERYDRTTNTQVFIDLNSLPTNDKTMAFNYSHGPRACTGRHLAREFLNKFFGVVLTRDEIDFRPKEKHVYSGRDNDNGDWRESLYQAQLLCGLIVKLLKERFWQTCLNIHG